MDNDLSIYRKILDLSEKGPPFAMALVVRAEGSTPRKAGVRAVIEETGKICGTIGGGSVEAEAQRRAVEACKSKQPVVFDFRLEGACAADVEPICGGLMRVLLDPTAAKDRVAYVAGAQAIEQRQKGVFYTSISTGVETKTTVRWIAESDVPTQTDFPGTNAIRSCLVRETPQLFTVGRVVNPSALVPEETTDSSEGHSFGSSSLDGLPTRPTPLTEVFVEPVIPKPLLLIVGGGHVGQALARQANLVGFDITVLDDRPEFAKAALFPEGVTTRCGDIAHEVAGFPISGDTYIVIVTRGHQHDAEALAACIYKPAAYVGIIGSRRKVALMRKSFIESRLATEDEFNRVFAPIGLDIGSVTVPEIAASIVAQLIAIRRKVADPCHRTPKDMVSP